MISDPPIAENVERGGGSSVSSRVGSKGVRSVLDFLAEPLPQTSGFSHSGTEISVEEPWAAARLSNLNLQSGWWWLECDADIDLSGVEVRLSCAADPLIVIPGSPTPASIVYLPGEHSHDATLLISPWPKRVAFRRLALRRMSTADSLGFVLKRAAILLGNGEFGSRLMALTRRLAAGQSIGVRQGGSGTTVPAPNSAPSGSGNPQLQARDLAADLRNLGDRGVEAFLGATDRLHKDAVEIVEREFQRSPNTEVIYCDVREGDRIQHHSGWDAELAKYCDYIGRPVFFRSASSQATTPWQSVLEAAKRSPLQAIRHIALPLVERPARSRARLPPVSLPTLSGRPTVSVVIPTGQRTDLLQKCLDGLVSSTDYSEIEVVIIDNGADRARLDEVLNQASQNLELTRIEDRSPFNFSQLCNLGVKQSTGEIVLLLNDDVEALEPDWLHRMIASATEQGVGAVGARLLYADRTIQHAGVMLGIGGACGHLWKGMPESEAACMPAIVYPGTRLAVTGACLAVERRIYEEIGGLDEQLFPIGFSDIDFCFRLHAAGYRNVYRGDAVLTHHESQSRGEDDDSLAKRRRRTIENAEFLRRWGHLIGQDPVVSPAYDPMDERGVTHRSLVRSNSS